MIPKKVSSENMMYKHMRRIRLQIDALERREEMFQDKLMSAHNEERVYAMTILKRTHAKLVILKKMLEAYEQEYKIICNERMIKDYKRNAKMRRQEHDNRKNIME